MFNFYNPKFKLSIIPGIFILVSIIIISAGCAILKPNIPWEQRWATSYCVTTDWEKLGIPSEQRSVLCSLSEEYQVTLNEAQGIVFVTALLVSLPDPENTVPVLGEYITALKEFVETSGGLTLADLFLKVTIDSDSPRYQIMKNLLNIGIISTWGQNPMAKWILNDKDIYFLKAHFDNLLYQIGYKPKI
jgi:hypothetical protein